MQRRIVLVIAGIESREFYNTLCLKDEGIEICPFKDGIDYLKHCQVDIVILDCGFDVNRGLDLLKEIKFMHPEVPVVFVTDLSSEETAIKAFKTGAREYFKKPVNIFEFQRTIEDLLEIKRAPQEKRTPFIEESSRETDELIKSATSDKPTNILRVIRYIGENLSEELSLINLAKEANLSKYHFCRIFKRYTGMNPMKFVTSMRIEKAKNLLERSDLAVSVVARQVGFHDPSDFDKKFKKLTGMTPTAYKDSLKAE
jgi:YesN/AraC family two-component response regulator